MLLMEIGQTRFSLFAMELWEFDGHTKSALERGIAGQNENRKTKKPPQNAPAERHL